MPDGLDDYLDPPQPQPFKTKRGALKFQPESDWSLSRLADVESEYQKTTGQRLPVNVRGQGTIHDKWNYDHADSADIGINPNSKEGQTLIAQLQRQNVPFLAFDRAIPGVATGPHVHIGRPSKRRSAQVQQKPAGLDSYLDPAPLDNYVDPPQRNPLTPPIKSPFAGVQAGVSGSQERPGGARRQQLPQREQTPTELLLNTIGGREKRGEDIQNILEGVTGAVAGTGRQLANAQELGMRVTPIGIAGRELSKRVTGFDPQAIPSKIRDASEYLESAVAENEAARPAPTTFAGNVRRGVGKGVGAAVVEMPKLILGGRALGAANLPTQGALARADEGVSGIVKGAAGGLVYHYGGVLTGKAFSGVSPYLAKVGNSLVWIAGPVAEQQLIATATGSEPPNLAQSIGENIPFGIMAGMGAKGKRPQPVQVKEGNTVRDAIETDLPKIVSRELEVVPPAVEAAERRQVQREFDKIKETEVAQRFQHIQFGEVEVLPDQSGARQGRIKVAEVADPTKQHFVKKSDLQGRGNARMIPIKESASQPVEVLPEKPQQPPETKGATVAPPSPENVASLPFMITRRMSVDLRERGYSQPEIDRLTPQQANEILTQPATATRLTEPSANVQWMPSKETGLPESGRMEGQAARAMGLEIAENPYRRVAPEDAERFKPLAEEWEAGWKTAAEPETLRVEPEKAVGERTEPFTPQEVQGVIDSLRSDPKHEGVSVSIGGSVVGTGPKGKKTNPRDIDVIYNLVDDVYYETESHPVWAQIDKMARTPGIDVWINGGSEVSRLSPGEGRIVDRLSNVSNRAAQIVDKAVPVDDLPSIEVTPKPETTSVEPVIPSVREGEMPPELGGIDARTKNWISDVLTNDATSTNAELVDYFQKEGGLNKDTADYIVSKRGMVKSLPVGLRTEEFKPDTSPVTHTFADGTTQIFDPSTGTWHDMLRQLRATTSVEQGAKVSEGVEGLTRRGAVEPEVAQRPDYYTMRSLPLTERGKKFLEFRESADRLKEDQLNDLYKGLYGHLRSGFEKNYMEGGAEIKPIKDKGIEWFAREMRSAYNKGEIKKWEDIKQAATPPRGSFRGSAIVGDLAQRIEAESKAINAGLPLEKRVTPPKVPETPIKEVINEATAQVTRPESTIAGEGAGLGALERGTEPAPSKPDLPKVKEAFRLPFIDPAERGNQARLKQSINLEYATESGRQIKKAVTIGKRQKQLENKHSVIGKLLDCLHA